MTNDYLTALTERCVADTVEYAMPLLRDLALKHRWTKEQLVEVTDMVGLVVAENTRNCGRMAVDICNDTLKIG